MTDTGSTDHVRATLPTPVSTASFWHSEPSEFLFGHRTTDDLPAAADIVIVGSGITGASIARFLAEDERAKGKSIVMLEAREACWGATGRNGGHCQPLLFDRGPEVAAFELKNVHAVQSYIEAHNVPCEWRSVSGCRTFWKEDLIQEAEEAIKELKEAAPDIGKMVTIIKDAAELAKHRVHPSCTGATLTEGAASLWPYKYVTFILEKLVKEGILNLQTTTPVTSITSTPSTFASNNNPPKPLYTLHTPRGPISTTTLLLATNGYTSSLLPSFADLIVPVRGTMSALLPPPAATLLPNSYGMVGALDQPKTADDYLVQRPYSGVPNPAAHYMFGGGRGASSLPCIGVSDDSVLDTGAAAYLRTALPKVLDLGPDSKPGDELEAVQQWTGIMGYSRDDHPWVGAVPDMPGVWLAGGYTGHGMPNGSLCGKAVVGMALAALEGKGEGVGEAMVDRGEMPRAYLISKERIERTRRLPTVEVQDLQGGFRV
ncbi:FAD dependent oxidoreductase-like protein [Mytilinidion resinicola]|uniref:FAD dependent oxidoreductase-like protein n=1 Tax=Mytilinidion resinicola TaxID=574789 RepID=A0A6A6Y380_9PEZI|nr:FAD dependent oxidoreductase-like protein [Mytilinidion resinicola]KAF2803242.1 FAD dependent oxidoreductase-like protein [Mytilinidion resinicola]